MTAYLYYRTDTGRVLVCSSRGDAPPPPGQAIIEVPDMVKPGSVRVDLNTLQVVAVDPPVVPLASVKAQATHHVNEAAEAARLRFLTRGAGQALEYLETEREARAYLADPSPNPTNYPWLKAEADAAAGAGGGPPPQLADVAAAVITQANAWKVAGATIKRLRRTAVLRIEAAGSRAAVEAAIQGITWPSP